MAIPDFLQFNCTNNDLAECSACQRNFVIPLTSTEGIYKDVNGKALILVTNTHYCPSPLCANKLRFIESGVLYDEVVSHLDGKIYNIGNINLIYQDHLCKGL